jgi:alpha-amylase
MQSSYFVVKVTRESYNDGGGRRLLHSPFFVHRCVFYGDMYPNKECYDESIGDHLRTLIRLRKTHAYGELKEYFASANCIGFARIGDSSHPGSGCVVLISNGDES